MANRILVLALVLAAALPTACKKGDMAAKQKVAMEARRAQVFADVDKVLQTWLDEMLKALPSDVKKYPKVKSPLVRWRLDSFAFDWHRPVDAAVVAAKGTTFEEEMNTIPEFFDVMEQFWNKKVDFKDYMVAYNKLKSTCKDPLALLLADFDHTFVHVEAFYGAQDMDGDDRAIYFFRHWQVAFHFPRDYSEAVSQYLARLCKAKLSAYCTTIPAEQLHFAMEKPYLGEVKRIVAEYLKDHPDCKLNRIFTDKDAFLTQVDQRLANLKDYTEDPVMPSSVSRKNFVGDVILTVRKSGIEYEDLKYLDFSKGWDLPAAEWAAFGKKVTSRTEGFEKERGPENLEVIRTDMVTDAPVSLLANFVEVWKKLPARGISFGARRRMDGLDKGTVSGYLQFREVPLAGRKLDIEGVGKFACRPLGQSDDTQDLVSKVTQAVWLDKDEIKTGTFAGGKISDLKPVDAKAAAAWLQKGVGVLAVSSNVTYERFLSVIDPLFFQCKDARCDPPTDLTPRVDVQVCGGK